MEGRGLGVLSPKARTSSHPGPRGGGPGAPLPLDLSDDKGGEEMQFLIFFQLRELLCHLMLRGRR